MWCKSDSISTMNQYWLCALKQQNKVKYFFRQTCKPAQYNHIEATVCMTGTLLSTPTDTGHNTI